MGEVLSSVITVNAPDDVDEWAAALTALLADAARRETLARDGLARAFDHEGVARPRRPLRGAHRVADPVGRAHPAAGHVIGEGREIR